MLGIKHARIIAAAGGFPVLLDLPKANPQAVADSLVKEFGVEAVGYSIDITQLTALEKVRDELMALVKHEMENAARLSVPLVVDLGEGANWLETKLS